ncbi:unannotated protein [freshwater metagenome]|uniref:Unannotated protein n=1 Tax=freshwater metagenome TaxID=449393 RepID=A0A6J7I3U0_9ZZZZ|nr:pyridoxal-phosphate dependent enzyme [Actinomycetota bacterium]MSW35715.1 pyridoxal-phosphate dependent enzyme [Actinomycetota bacterium]
MDDATWWLRCRSCAVLRVPGSVDYVCAGCGGELVVEYAAPSATPRAGITGLWRWGDRLPLRSAAHIITLGEGGTPQVRLGTRIHQELGVASAEVKCEHLNPTGSFKDRIASVAVSLAAERGLSGLAGTSSGNGGAAAAAYTARSGMPLTLFSLSDVAPQKLLQIRALGGRVLLVQGLGHDGSATMRAATAVARHSAEKGVMPFLTGGRYSPEAMEGAVTIAYEIAEDRPATTVVYCPVGGGGLLSAIGRGFRAQAPHVRLVGVQPRGCATLSRAMRGDFSGLPGPVTTGVSGLQVGVLFDGPGSVEAITQSGGHLTEVDDDAIAAAQRLLAREEGILVEPAGATALAGALADAARGLLRSDDHVVLVATGAGWKDTASLQHLLSDAGGLVPSVPVITIDEIEEVLGERL